MKKAKTLAKQRLPKIPKAQKLQNVSAEVKDFIKVEPQSIP